MEDHILNTENYTYEPFSHNGFSGSLYLATPKDGSLPKLLIKHENPSSACNEFMYSRLAGLLRISAPKAYMMEVSKKDKKQFATPYVVGIEYIDGMRPFTLEEMRGSVEWQMEYAGQYALAAMFDQDDRVQLTMTSNGHITGYDFTEAFWLTDMGMSHYMLSEEHLTDMLIRRLQASMQRGTSMLSAGGSVVRKHFGLPEDAAIPSEYLEPMQRLLRLTEEQIEELTDVLFEFYPVSVPVYFEEYIKMLKKKIAAYFKSVGEEI